MNLENVAFRWTGTAWIAYYVSDNNVLDVKAFTKSGAIDKLYNLWAVTTLEGPLPPTVPRE